MKTPDNLEKYADKFSDPKFWDKIKKTAKKAGIKVIYAAMQLYYALQSPNISSKEKLIIIGALGYFILPIDLIPDFIPVAGFTDDLAALVLAVVKVSKAITPDVKDRARAKIHEWFGNYDENEIIIRPEDYSIEPDDQDQQS